MQKAALESSVRKRTLRGLGVALQGRDRSPPRIAAAARGSRGPLFDPDAGIPGSARARRSREAREVSAAPGAVLSFALAAIVRASKTTPLAAVRGERH